MNGRTTSNLAHELIAFLREAAERRFLWGEHDCGLMACDWIERVSGRDAAGVLRGAYHDEISLRALAGSNGWPQLFGHRLEGIGMQRTAVPQLGDVALILAHDGRLRAAICTRDGGGSFVTAAEPEGLFGIRDARVARAWTFP